MTSPPSRVSSVASAVSRSVSWPRMWPTPLGGGPFRTYADHRMAHAGVILGLGVEGVLVEDIATTSKTFPDFAGAWTALFT